MICFTAVMMVAQMVKHLPAKRETQVQFLVQENLLEKGLVTHSSVLAWAIPRTGEPGGLQSMAPCTGSTES